MVVSEQSMALQGMDQSITWIFREPLQEQMPRVQSLLASLAEALLKVTK